MKKADCILKFALVFGAMFFAAFVLFFVLMPAGFAGVPYSVFAVFIWILISTSLTFFVDAWKIHAAAISMLWLFTVVPGLTQAWERQSTAFFFREYGVCLFIYAFHMLIQCGICRLVKTIRTQKQD